MAKGVNTQKKKQSSYFEGNLRRLALGPEVLDVDRDEALVEEPNGRDDGPGGIQDAQIAILGQHVVGDLQAGNVLLQVLLA